MATTKTSIVPTVDMGATAGAGSDRYPYTIIEVSPSGKSITVQQDEVITLEGSDQTGDRIYSTVPNPNAPRMVYTLRKNGSWILKGQPITAHWHAIYPGERRYYQDPSF